MEHRRLDQFLIGILFQNDKCVLLESRQKNFAESDFGDFHQQWVEGMPAFA